MSTSTTISRMCCGRDTADVKDTADVRGTLVVSLFLERGRRRLLKVKIVREEITKTTMMGVLASVISN